LVSQEDEDSWLDVDASSFEEMLQKGSASKSTTKAPDAMDVDATEDEKPADDAEASKHADRLRELSEKVEKFVEGEGDLEGARFEECVIKVYLTAYALTNAFSEELSEEEFSDEKFSDNSDDDEPEEPETPEAIAQRQAALDKLVPGLDPSEYGKMPASYSNSQKVAVTTIASDVVGDTDQQNAKDSTTVPKERPIRRPILPRDDFDGVDSDDETDEDEDDEEDEEDRPQVVDEVEIDMGEEEAEFIEFSRKALGISDEQWKDIVKERQDRGGMHQLWP
jgi:hypothetical protein